jgi:hypothetical protein
VLAVGAAVSSERAFRAASAGEPPDRRRGEDNYFDDIDDTEEEKELALRASMGILAATYQSIATYLAAGVRRWRRSGRFLLTNR